MLGCLAVGLAAMELSERWWSRAIGVIALFAFIVAGVFQIADPAFLAADDEAD